VTEHGSLGRGSGRIRFYNDKVVKTTDASEFLLVSAVPEVFVDVISFDRKDERTVEYTMPLLEPVNVDRDGEAALVLGAEKLKALWSKRGPVTPCNWKSALLDHLMSQRSRHNLDVDPALISYSIEKVSPTGNGPLQQIHGDPTLANLLYDGVKGWVWCDPLVRTFIPGDPHVDLGKMYQSCWGYERILQGSLQRPCPNTRLMSELAHATNLNVINGLWWAVIHFIRALPYQRALHRKIFEEWLLDPRIQ